ncbi:trehalose operon repressor [Saccharibacillus endophyticus]|uniref:Trehalose operon repressor n=1 Tax=Saccharibacillus endophyticus TaxID=2060666 RepID=A0ABQ1ZJD2_9BACL|nr:trehalose operon repressor [Saccharibacillus endophyticus]GGH68851.1 HTH-type transcriptional regulator TreR [Saccharibacillus endophyticus]
MNKNIFSQIYTDYTQRIETGLLKTGIKLPSENEIAEEYATSRETVRKALHLLSQNGYIHKIRGKGSYVLDINRMEFPISGLVSFKELSERLGRPARTLVHETIRIPCPQNVARQLQITEQEEVWKVVRAREIEEEKVILDKDYFLASVIPALTAEIAADSIYAYLEGDCSLKIAYAKKEISVEKVSAEDKRLLDLGRDTHIVVVRNYVHLEDTTLFQYTESRHRLDKFQFVDFARRAVAEE